MTQSPQVKALTEVRQGMAADDNLMNAAILFNTLIRDGNAIACDDEVNEGFNRMY
jgi:hypothetical protein